MTLSERPAASHRPRNPDAPEVTVAPSVSAAAGKPAAVPVRVVHRGKTPARIRVTIFGLDARWAPAPLDLGVLQPGDSAAITLTILPERGALGASYPFTIAAEASTATAPPSGAGSRGRPVVGVAEATLVLDAAERVSMSLVPSTPSAVFSRGIRVDITNPSGAERTFTLIPDAAAGASLRLRHKSVTVPPQQTISVAGRVRVKKPTIFGGSNTHTFTVAAQGSGAPEWVEGTLRSTALVGKGVRTVIGLIVVVALWATLAVVFIPKISDAFKSKNDVTTAVSTAEGGSGAGAGTGADGGANGAAGGSGNGGPGSGAGGASPGANGANGGQPAGGYVVSGTVTGPGAVGASATLTPVSLSSAGDDGSLPTAQAGPGASPKALRGSTSAFANGVIPAAAITGDGPLGKIPGPIAAVPREGFRATTILTTEKGEFTFSGVTAPGYYLLTLGKEGFQTQRFLINSANLASPQPMKVQLVPGTGKLSGSVTGPGGAIGAATIVVTDGTVTLQTSSVSASTHTGTPGSWALDQVSTPGTYLVTATAPGLGSASKLVTLDAAGSARVDLQLSAGQGSIVGTVSGEDSLGAVGGLGGITVTAKGGDTTRTATTVTSAAMRGAFVLPNLPAPGDYTLTISGAGFLTQTRQVSLGASGGTVTVNATLSRADAVVAGMVTGLDANGKAEGGLGGVGLTLASNDVTMKTMTTSGSSAGSYQFTGVAPGSYVLTAVQFGRVTASATVELAASTSQAVNLVLKADIGAELPATAHIRGQVVDSRSGGPLTCDRALETVSADNCVATVTVTAPKDPADSSQGTVTYTTKATAALNFVYTVPDLSDPNHAGLPPGLYTVTVTAPGYESTVTHVQVAQGQTVPAPAATMPPLGIISGTVTTRVGTPAKASCVLAVPTSVSLPKDLPTSCTVSTDGNTCTATGISGAQPCALTSMGGKDEAPLGTYTVRGLTHGKYQMVLISQDPEYVYTVGTVPTVTLDLGADGQFNAVLDRLGRINVLIQQINSVGQLVPENDATLTIKSSPGDTPQTLHLLAGAPANNPTITQLAAGAYSVTAQAMISPPGGGTPVPSTATAVSAPTGLNQTVNVTVVLANRSGPVVGRVVANVNNQPLPVPGGVLVSITGTIVTPSGASGDGTGTVTTDANGCYAIVPDGWDGTKNSELTSTACTSPVPSTSQVKLSTATQGGTLITDTVRVGVQARSGVTSAYPTTDKTIGDCPVVNGCGDKVRVLDPISVTALPLTIAPTLDVVGPAGFTRPSLGASPVDIDKVSAPALAGTVTLRPSPGAAWGTSPTACTDPTGADVTTPGAECSRLALTFADSNLGATNVAIPGLYQFSVSVDGFNPVAIYLLCQFGQPTCVFVAGANDGFGDAIRLSVMQKPELSVDVSLPVTNGKYSPTAWADAVAQQTVGTSLGVLKVVADTPTDDGNVPPTITDLNAHLTFGGKQVVLAPNPGNYTFTVSGVKGYNGATTVGANCGADFTDPCQASPPVAAVPYPTFDAAASTVALDHATDPDGHPFEFDDITATVTPNPGDAIHVSVADPVSPATAGIVTWADSTSGLLTGQTIPRSYTVTFSLQGFETSNPVTVNCTSGGSCSTGPITLKRLPAASGTVTIPLAEGASTLTIPANAVTFTPSTPTLSVSLGTPSYSTELDGTRIATAALTFSDSTAGGHKGLVIAKDYSVSIAIPGYETETAGCDASTGDCVIDSRLTLHPQPAMQLTILPSNDTNAPPTISVDNGAGSAAITSDLDGALTWKQSGPDGVVTPRQTPYVIRALLPDYQVSVNGSPVTSVPFTCKSSSDCTFPSIVLSKKTDLTVKIVDGAGTTVTSNARISLKGSSSPITANGSATFAGQPTTGVKKTNNVWSDDTYTLSVDAAGYRFVTGLGSTADSVRCTGSNGEALDGVHLFPGGTTTCTVTLTALGAITGTTVWDATSLAGGPATVFTPLPNVTLTAANAAGKTVKATAATGTEGNGFRLTGTVSTSGDVEGLTAGEWTITGSQSGYSSLSGTVTVGCAAAPAPPPDPAPDPGPDSAGYCTYGYVVTGSTTDAGSTSYLTLVGQDVVAHFVPVPVGLTVNFIVGGAVTNDLPAATVTLTDGFAVSWTCDLRSGATNTKCTPGTNSLTFGNVPPGNYDIGVTFDNNKYSQIVKIPVTVKAGGNTTPTSVAITARTRAVTGFVKDNAGNTIGGAHVQLHDSSGAVAKDWNGSEFEEQKTVSSGPDQGKFTFTAVADGVYHFVVTAAGYADNTTGNFTVNFDNGDPPVQNVTLLAPTRQTLSMTFTLPAGLTGLTLTGAAVTLTQTDNNDRVITDGPLTAATISGTGASGSPYTSTLLQVPTGTYTVSVSQSSAAAPFALPAGSVIVEAGIDTLNAPLTLDVAAVTFKVTSSDSHQVLPANVPFTLSLNGTSAAPNPEMVLSSDSTSASKALYLPPGTFSWQPVLSGSTWDGWSASSAKTVVVNSGDVSGSSSAALTAPTPTVKVTVTNGGTALGANQSVALDVTQTGVLCGSKTDANGVIACTGLSTSTAYGVTATWTDANNGVHVGYQSSTTDSVGNGAVTVDLAVTPSTLITITDGGSASSGATVKVYDSDGSQVNAGTVYATDSLGIVLISGLTDAEKYYAFASKGGKTTRYLAFTAAEDEAVEVSGELSATVSLTVTVKDNLGAPIDSATVDIALNASSSISLGSNATNASGTVTFSGLPAGEKVDVKASKTGYSNTQKKQVSLDNSTNTVDDLTLTANPAPATASVTVTVKDSNDDALAGGETVSVTSNPAGGTCAPTTDANGAVECTGLTVGQSYTFSASWTDSQTPPLAHTGTSDPVSPTEAGPNVAAIKLD